LQSAFTCYIAHLFKDVKHNFAAALPATFP
jgi:hypothetical protein